jgi:hypothetical protein
MSTCRSNLVRAIAAGVLCTQGGCLSLGLGLGGRTTYVQEAPETLGRITALETRVAALEQSFAPRPLAEALPLVSPSDAN